jgi:chromate transporter
MHHLHIGPAADEPPLRLRTIFFAFSRVAWSSFGQATFWLQRELVERRRWLSQTEFVELLALAQLLPGPGGVNLAACVGQRAAGWAGAVAAVGGFMGWSFLLMLGVGMLYQHYGGLHLVRRVLAGMSDVAAGLLLAMGIALIRALPRRWHAWLCGGLAFVGVGLLHWPLVLVVGILAPGAITAAWREKQP